MDEEEKDYTVFFANGARFHSIARTEKEAVKLAYENLESITGLPKNKIVSVIKVELGKPRYEQHPNID